MAPIKTHCVNGHELSLENRTNPSKNLPHGRCKLCKQNHDEHWSKTESGRQSRKKSSKLWVKNNPDKKLNSRLWTAHRLSLRQYEALLHKQHNRCAVCREVFETTPCVDHNHLCCSEGRSCGKCNRGLLCSSCNKGLGNFKDDPKILLKAVRYIERNNG